MRRKCAVCGDTCQTNVRFKWQRHSDNVVFHICGMCAEEPNKVTADSVKIEVGKTYTTVDSEYASSTADGTLRKRPALSTDYYKTNGSNLAPARVRGRIAKK